MLYGRLDLQIVMDQHRPNKGKKNSPSCRNARFSQAACEVIISEVARHKALLFGSLKSNIITNDKKIRVWKDIAGKVSAVDTCPRSWQEVRKKWADMASRTKKKESQRRRESRRTGGGAPPKELTHNERMVVEIIGETAVSGIPGSIDTSFMPEPETSDDEPAGSPHYQLSVNSDGDDSSRPSTSRHGGRPSTCT